jgi:hypothetical protein
MTEQAMLDKPEELVDRYVALWNEPVAETRQSMIRELWTEGGAHILEPPGNIRDAAAALGFAPPNLNLEARGYEALEVRVSRAYEEFVVPGQFFFRSRGNVSRLKDVVKFNWEMVSTDGGDVAAVGLEIFVLDDDGKIRLDYQFIES